MGVVEDYSPLSVGDTQKPFACVFQEIDPGTGRLRTVSLAGLTISMRMRDVEAEESEARNCAGTWVVDSESEGTAHYLWTADDVAASGIFELQITLTDAFDETLHSDIKRIEIAPVL